MITAKLTDAGVSLSNGTVLPWTDELNAEWAWAAAEHLLLKHGYALTTPDDQQRQNPWPNTIELNDPEGTSWAEQAITWSAWNGELRVERCSDAQRAELARLADHEHITQGHTTYMGRLAQLGWRISVPSA